MAGARQRRFGSGEHKEQLLRNAPRACFFWIRATTDPVQLPVAWTLALPADHYVLSAISVDVAAKRPGDVRG